MERFNSADPPGAKAITCPWCGGLRLERFTRPLATVRRFRYRCGLCLASFVLEVEVAPWLDASVRR